MAPLLELDNVKTHFPVMRGAVFPRRVGTVKAVDGVSLAVDRCETVGLVGESGCGKSTLARTILRLAPATEGRILVDGEDILRLAPRALRPIRRSMQLIFQDPYASLNPRMTVFDALAEPLIVHGLARRREVAGHVIALMEMVGLAARFMKKYPHEFSGGQRQRVAIARALALRPSLVIADEPVSALDVSVQAQILNLLADLRAQLGMTLVVISHDLGVVKHLSDRIAVMYLGRIVEIGPALEVFERPCHPYTQALLSAIPIPDPAHERSRERILLRGDPPSPLNPPSGCAFHPRCIHADEACARTTPPLELRAGGGLVACIKAK